MQAGIVTHNIPPVFDNKSRVLILGSIPSPKSREVCFFYGHPQNRFWKVLAAVLGAVVPENNEEKKKLLLDNKIALWDVLESCEIKGASDSSIKNAKANDIGKILGIADIKAVFLTGKTAYKYYQKFLSEKYDVPYYLLPSPSSANCANFTIEQLESAYKIITQYI